MSYLSSTYDLNDYMPCAPYFGSIFGSRGVSDESAKLERQDIETRNRDLVRASESNLSRIINAKSNTKLLDLYAKCKNANWDGRDALPIPFNAILEAEQVLTQLPKEFPLPEIYPERTGEVGLEWYRSPYCVLVLSLAGDGYIYYSGLFGFKNADYGSKRLAGQLNKKIVSLLEDIYK